MMHKVVVNNKTELWLEICKRIKQRGYSADLNDIDVSQIKDMSRLFNIDFSSANPEIQETFGDIDLHKFNGDISEWDVSNVENMQSMFADSLFNGDLSRWNVVNVKNMFGMFFNSKFNRIKDLSIWNIENVEDMSLMFAGSAIEDATALDEWIRIWKRKARRLMLSTLDEDYIICKVEGIFDRTAALANDKVPSWYYDIDHHIGGIRIFDILTDDELAAIKNNASKDEFYDKFIDRMLGEGIVGSDINSIPAINTAIKKVVIELKKGYDSIHNGASKAFVQAMINSFDGNSVESQKILSKLKSDNGLQRIAFVLFNDQRIVDNNEIVSEEFGNIEEVYVKLIYGLQIASSMFKKLSNPTSIVPGSAEDCASRLIGLYVARLYIDYLGYHNHSINEFVKDIVVPNIAAAFDKVHKENKEQEQQIKKQIAILQTKLETIRNAYKSDVQNIYRTIFMNRGIIREIHKILQRNNSISKLPPGNIDLT